MLGHSLCAGEVTEIGLLTKSMWEATQQQTINRLHTTRWSKKSTCITNEKRDSADSLTLACQIAQ